MLTVAIFFLSSSESGSMHLHLPLWLLILPGERQETANTAERCRLTTKMETFGCSVGSFGSWRIPVGMGVAVETFLFVALFDFGEGFVGEFFAAV